MKNVHDKGKKTYQCEHCHYEFGQKGNLTRHLKLGNCPVLRQQTSTAIQPVTACDLCPDKTLKPGSLSAHNRKYHPERVQSRIPKTDEEVLQASFRSAAHHHSTEEILIEEPEPETEWISEPPRKYSRKELLAADMPLALLWKEDKKSYRQKQAVDWNNVVADIAAKYIPQDDMDPDEQ